MTIEQANEDTNFEAAPKNHILRDIDRMRRTNAQSASSLDWFPVAEFDVGKKANYFSYAGGFLVEKRKDDAPRVKSLGGNQVKARK